MLGAVVLSWEDKFGKGSPSGSDILPLVYPSRRNLCIASAVSLMGRCWVMWFCLGRINVGKDHPLGQLCYPLVYLTLRNLGISSAMILMGMNWVLWFCLRRGYLSVTSTLHLEGIPL